MKIHIRFIVITFLFFCCNNNTEEQEKDPLNSSSENVKKSQDIYNNDVSDENKKGVFQDSVSIKQLKFNGIDFITSKQELKAILGKPDSITEPKYDCGPFSEDWQDIRFFQYFYGKMNYIVYENNAEIQNIEFTEGDVFEINGIQLDKSLSLEDVANRLNLNIKEIKSKNQILLYPKENLDQYFILIFKKGYLHKFDRLEPC